MNIGLTDTDESEGKYYLWSAAIQWLLGNPPRTVLLSGQLYDYKK